MSPAWFKKHNIAQEFGSIQILLIGFLKLELYKVYCKEDKYKKILPHR